MVLLPYNKTRRLLVNENCGYYVWQNICLIQWQVLDEWYR